jgi:hypothetical protein
VSSSSPSGEPATIDSKVHSWAVAIVDTPTPPEGPRRIELSRWEDLLHASELLGRPILRLRGGEGGPEGRLFYVADGAQNYVFDFRTEPVNVTQSGAYASRNPPVRVPAATPPPAPDAGAVPLLEAPAVLTRLRPPLVQPLPVPRAPAPPVPDVTDAGQEADRDSHFADSDLPSSTVVERRIREMIHELLNEYRRLPASSDRLELGTEHIQRAVDMLHLGRYAAAQTELNRAAHILLDDTGK